MGTNVLENVIEIQRQRAEQAEQSFRELVATLAGNPAKPPKPEAIDAVLIASRHSVDELAEAVKLVQRRESLRSEIRSIDSRQSDRASLVAKIEVAKAELQAAQDRFKETTFPIQGEINSINQLHHRRAECERELRAMVDDNDDAELTELGHQIQHAAKRRDEQQRLLRELQSRLSSSDEGIRALAVGQVARAEEALATMTAECEDLVRQQSELLNIAVLG